MTMLIIVHDEAASVKRQGHGSVLPYPCERNNAVGLLFCADSHVLPELLVCEFGIRILFR